MQPESLSDFRKKSCNLVRFGKNRPKMSEKKLERGDVRSQKRKKRRGEKGPLKYHRPKKDKIRGTLVLLLWRAAAPGLKPLRLPRAHLPHPRVNKTKQHTACCSIVLTSGGGISYSIGGLEPRKVLQDWPGGA